MKPDYLKDEKVWIEYPTNDVRLEVNKLGITNVNITELAKEVYSNTKSETPWINVPSAYKENLIISIIDYIEKRPCMLFKEDCEIVYKHMDNISDGKWRDDETQKEPVRTISPIPNMGRSFPKKPLFPKK